jgi:hypothetical protein
MKYLFFSTLFMSVCFLSNGQLNQVFVEQITHDNSLLEDQTSYRLFAQFSNPQDMLLAYHGDSECQLSFTSTTQFYISPVVGSCYVLDIPQAFGSGVPGELGEASFYTSYVSIGLYDSGGSIGLPINEGGPSVNVPGLTSMNSYPSFVDTWGAGFAAGGNIIANSVNGASIFTFEGNVNGMGVGVNNSVFLGQFTTDGIFEYELNLTTNDFGEGTTVHSHCSSPIEGLIYSSEELSQGCTDDSACNYSSLAIYDDYSCLYIGDECSLNPDYTASYMDENCNCLEQILGDFTGDGSINVTDLGGFLGVFGSCNFQELSAGDFTGDGCVNTSDVGGFLGAFGQTFP